MILECGDFVSLMMTLAAEIIISLYPLSMSWIIISKLKAAKTQIFFKVKLMQLIRRIVPPMSNEIITLVKDTSLANTIALTEVIWAGDRFMKKGLVWPLFFTGIYYLAFNGVLTIFFGWVEKKLGYYRV